MGFDKTHNPIMIVCQSDGRIEFINKRYTKEITSLDSLNDMSMLSDSLQCKDLMKKLHRFMDSENDTLECKVICNNESYIGKFHRLHNIDAAIAAGGQSKGGKILIELTPNDEGTESNYLMRAGRMTSKLIHDFKNQMGGLKLYTTFLKKRFADNPEALEITEKILQSVDNMANHSAAVSKLTRPMAISKTSMHPADLFTFTKSIVSELRELVKQRSVTMNIELADTLADTNDTDDTDDTNADLYNECALGIDKGLMQVSLRTIIARSIEVSPQNSEVLIRMTARSDGVVLDISDQGSPVKNQSNVFDYFSGDAMTQMSFDLAMARRIIEEHGFRLEAHANMHRSDVNLNTIRIIFHE